MSTLPVPIGGANLPSAPTEALQAAVTSAKRYAAAEKSEATRRAYASDWRHFEAWCGTAGAVALPATADTVAVYLAALADAGLKASTINRRAAAITYWHRQRDYMPPTGAERVKAVQRGIRRTIGTRVDRKAPAIAKMVTAMIKRMPDNLRGHRDRALIVLGFAAALRRSELAGLDVADIERTADGVFVHVRRSKTDQEGAGQQIAVPRGGKLKPVAALDAWLAASDITSGPLFRRISKSGRVSDARLSDRAVAEIVKHWAKAARLDPEIFSGHSLRAGFVTDALAHGADPLKVMDITRHTQVQTLKGYDRRAKAFKDHAGRGFL